MNMIRSLREKQLLTQEDLARISGLSVVTISRLETGRSNPSIKTIRALATAFRMEAVELRDMLISEQTRMPI
jgi:transcriptional regulator with XRE-family HTH domain